MFTVALLANFKVHIMIHIEKIQNKIKRLQTAIAKKSTISKPLLSNFLKYAAEIQNVPLITNILDNCMEIMGEAFFEYLLFSPSKNKVTPLYRTQENFKELYEFLLARTLSYLDKKNDVNELTLSQFLLSSKSEEQVVQFVKAKLAQIEFSSEINTVKHDVFIETNYANPSIYADPAFPLFKYDNEKIAFKSALENGPLSVEKINSIHTLALIAKDIKETCRSVIYSNLGSVGYDCSLRGFLEVKECAAKGWMTLERDEDSFSTHVFFPKSSKILLKKLLTRYNDHMKTPLARIDKLKTIIKLASDLSRMHYFNDANKRTSYIMFIAELVKYGFLPSFVDDRIVFRNKSQDELLPIVQEGMEKGLNALLTLTQPSTNPQMQTLFKHTKTQLDRLKKHADKNTQSATSNLLYLRDVKKQKRSEVEKLQPWHWERARAKR